METCFNYILTFEECMSILRDTSNVSLNRFTVGKFSATNQLSAYIQTILKNAYSFDFTDSTDAGLSGLPFVEWDSGSNKWIFKDLFLKLVNYLFRQYGGSYCMTSPSEEDSNYIMYSTLFLDNLLNLVFTTYDKYKVLFENYEAQQNFLKGIVTTHNENGQNSNDTSSSSSGYSKNKETPQNAVTLENLGDDYNTNVNVNSGESTASGLASFFVNRTETTERDTIIERLKELEEKFAKLWNLWGYEFRELFWEV